MPAYVHGLMSFFSGPFYGKFTPLGRSCPSLIDSYPFARISEVLAFIRVYVCSSVYPGQQAVSCMERCLFYCMNGGSTTAYPFRIMEDPLPLWFSHPSYLQCLPTCPSRCLLFVYSSHLLPSQPSALLCHDASHAHFGGPELRGRHPPTGAPVSAWVTV